MKRAEEEKKKKNFGMAPLDVFHALNLISDSLATLTMHTIYYSNITAPAAIRNPAL